MTVNLTRNSQTAPYTTGWNLVQFTNGSVGVARWTGKAWAWGSLASNVNGLTISGVSYLGSSISAIQNNSIPFQKAISQLPTSIGTTLITMIDHGRLGLKGQPVLFAPDGTAVGNSGRTGSEADSTNIIPSPSISTPSWAKPLGDLLNWIGTERNWVRVLEFVGGSVMIGIAFRELAKS